MKRVLLLTVAVLFAGSMAMGQTRDQKKTPPIIKVKKTYLPPDLEKMDPNELDSLLKREHPTAPMNDVMFVNPDAAKLQKEFEKIGK